MNKLIVLADDDFDDRLVFSEAVSFIKNCSLVSFEAGDLLLESLSKRDISLPDVIFLDINMPRLTGIEVLKILRDNPYLCDIPVVVYSTTSSLHHIDECFKCGANLYLIKPVDFNVLKASISYVLSIDFKEFQTSKQNFLVKV